jgi:hypothetical protein
MGVSARTVTAEKISANTAVEQVRLMGTRLLANVGVGREIERKRLGGFNSGIISRPNSDASEILHGAKTAPGFQVSRFSGFHTHTYFGVFENTSPINFFRNREFRNHLQ